MNCRSLLSLLLLLTTASGFSQSAELEALRSKRDSEIQRVDRQYVAALEKLLTKLTKAGRLDDALEVRKEIRGKARNRLVGKWKYTYQNRVHYREFTDTHCILTGEVSPGGKLRKEWSRRYRLISPTYAIVEGVGVHEIRKDGKLTMSSEGYLAERVER